MTPTRKLRLEHFARAGLAARGGVYMLVGGLALTAAIGAGGGVGGNESALRTLLSQPFGAILLALAGFGLLFFTAWRLYSALADPDRHGTSAKGLGTRAVHVLSGLVNAGLAVTAFNLALGYGAGGGGDDAAAQDWTRWLLTQPFGRWLTAGVGAGIVAAGAFHLWKSWKGDMLKRLSVPAARRDLALMLGRIGYAARGIVFGLIGVFLIVAAIRSDSDEAKGLGGALKALEDQPFGWALLALTAAGLAAFGAFGFVQAAWRRIEEPDLSGAKAAVGALSRSG
jgi:hypothetical protein